MNDPNNGLAAQSGGERSLAAPTLLTIPQELRDQMYDNLLVVANGVLDLGLESSFDRGRTYMIVATYKRISKTCRQLAYEARAHLFEKNIIAMECGRRIKTYVSYLELVLKRVRHLTFWLVVPKDERKAIKKTEYALVLDIIDGNVSLRIEVSDVWPCFNYHPDPRDVKDESVRQLRMREAVEGDKCLGRAEWVVQQAWTTFGESDLGALQQLHWAFGRVGYGPD